MFYRARLIEEQKLQRFQNCGVRFVSYFGFARYKNGILRNYCGFRLYYKIVWNVLIHRIC